MKRFYIVWLCSRGCKEIYSITEHEYRAKAWVKLFNEYYKEKNAKARAYYTICEEGRPYYHKEVK